MQARRAWASVGTGWFSEEREEDGEGEGDGDGDGDGMEDDGEAWGPALPCVARPRRWLTRMTLMRIAGGQIEPMYTGGTPLPHADSRKSRCLGCVRSFNWS